MSRTQRALSTKIYYDTKALLFIQQYSDYKTVDFKRFVQAEHEKLQSQLQHGENRENITAINCFDKASNGKSPDELRFMFPLLSTQTIIYTETIQSDIGCYYAVFGETIDGLERVTKETYHKRLFARHNLTSQEDFTEFTKRQKTIESLAFISALLRQLV